MALARRVTIAAATVVSAPGVLLAGAACVYILYAIATEQWYRQWFLAHGFKMAALYLAFAAGVICLAWLALHRTRGRLAILLVVIGLAAACALELELYDEAERVLPLGLLFGPYIAWAIAWLLLRSRPAPPPAPEWQDSRM